LMVALRMLILFALLLLAAACLPVEPAVVQHVSEEQTHTPTHVVLIKATARPTPTEMPVEPEIEPELVIDPGEDDLDTYYGGLAITLDNVGQTLMMRPKQGFLLKLGETFDWSVSFSAANIITANQKVTLEPGEQGVFVAREKGSTNLIAIGKPQCLLEDPPCTRPNVMFQMTIIVE
jgi:hypothetical protein